MAEATWPRVAAAQTLQAPNTESARAHAYMCTGRPGKPCRPEPGRRHRRPCVHVRMPTIPFPLRATSQGSEHAGLEGALRTAACTVPGRGNALLVLLRARCPGAEFRHSPTGPDSRENKDGAGSGQRSPGQHLKLDQMGQADPLLPKSPPGRVRCSMRGLQTPCPS